VDLVEEIVAVWVSVMSARPQEELSSLSPISWSSHASNCIAFMLETAAGSHEARRYAILIGVEPRDPGNASDLTGCVRDIQEICQGIKKVCQAFLYSKPNVDLEPKVPAAHRAKEKFAYI
jgi:hypothetical protein